MKTGRVARDALAGPRNPLAVLFLAALTAFCLSVITMAGATGERLASALEARLSGQVTIVVWGQGLESADAAAARAAEGLATQAGVRQATVLDADDSDATVGELIAGKSLGSDGPRLLSLSGVPDAIAPTSHLKRALDADRLVTAVDDHRGAIGPLEARALSGAGVAVVVGVVLIVGLFALSWVSGVHGVGAARARYDLMTRLGADPTFIGAMVGRGAASSAFVGGVVGIFCANLLLFTATVQAGVWRALGAPFYARPHLSDGLWTVAWPLVVAAIAAVGAGLGARGAMIRLERRI